MKNEYSSKKDVSRSVLTALSVSLVMKLAAFYLVLRLSSLSGSVFCCGVEICGDFLYSMCICYNAIGRGLCRELPID